MLIHVSLVVSDTRHSCCIPSSQLTSVEFHFGLRHTLSEVHPGVLLQCFSVSAQQQQWFETVARYQLTLVQTEPFFRICGPLALMNTGLQFAVVFREFSLKVLV